MSNNYPIGAEQDARAPWNQDSSPANEEVSVWASNTLSKNDTLEIEEGKYDSSNLLKEWKQQKYTAKQALDLAAEFAKSLYSLTLSKVLTSETDMTAEIVAKAVKVFNACEGWEEDEFEVILE